MLATDFEQFVASVQPTLDREGPAMMANKDDEAIAKELASAWDELGLTG